MKENEFQLKGEKYVLSVILSFLKEVDGTSFLLTNKSWSKTILPIFRVPKYLYLIHGIINDGGNDGGNDHAVVNDGGNDDTRHRHRFLPLPIQCPSVLLHRLNSVRLYNRIIYMKGKGKDKDKDKEQKENDAMLNATNANANANTDMNMNTMNMNKNMNTMNMNTMNMNKNKSCNHYYYPCNMTTEEIAWEEWTNARTLFQLLHIQQHLHNSIQQNTRTHKNTRTRTRTTNNVNNNAEIQQFLQSCEQLQQQLTNANRWPAKLQLLRYRSPPSNNNYSFRSKLPPLPISLSISLSLSSNIANITLQPPPKILPGATLLASYPRSGNTLLRTLLERTTSTITGSDTRPDRTLSKALSTIHSLVGEGIVSPNTTPVIKSHFPERRGYRVFTATRVILLVRNPFDAIDSYWNMCCTNTHTDSVGGGVYEDYQDLWRGLVRSEIGTWCQFLGYWLEQCDTCLSGSSSSSSSSDDGSSDGRKEGGPSVLLVRFEDLVQNTQQVMEDVMTFLTVEDFGPSNGNGNSNGNDNGKESQSQSELHPFWKWRIRCALGLEDGMDLKMNPSGSSSSTGNATANGDGDGYEDRGAAVKSSSTSATSSSTSTSTSVVSNHVTTKQVDTSALGSYKPRSLDTTNELQSQPKHDCNSNSKRERSSRALKDATMEQGPKGDHPGTGTGTGTTRKPSAIGKSIGKGRYSEEDLRDMHDIAQEEVLWHSSRGRVNMLQELGYDVFEQGFPLNFDIGSGGEDHASNWDFIYKRKNSLKKGTNASASASTNRNHGISKTKSTVRVNQGAELRPSDSPYGRAMTRWRRSQTSDDTKPFPLNQR